MSETKVTFAETETLAGKIKAKQSDNKIDKKKQEKGQSRTLEIEVPTLMKATGLSESNCKMSLYPVLKKILSEPGTPDKVKAENVRKFLGTMVELKPRDGLEGMLISQMLLTFQDAVRYLALAEHNKQHPDISIKYQNQGIRLMRLYNQQLETLDKHRNKGKQKMTVKHIHIHPGSQAIIGEVNQGGGGDV